MPDLNPIRAVNRVVAGGKFVNDAHSRANLTIVERVVSMRPGNTASLTPDDFRRVAAKWNVSPAALHTIADKESGPHGGFWKMGRLVIACEPHIFSRYTRNAFDLEYPHLSYPNFIKRAQAERLPKRWMQTWGKHPMQLSPQERWQLWAWWGELNPDAAICAISMGRFQVMGFHWKAFGFDSPLALLEFANGSEANQLDLCVRWFQANDKLDDLRALDWGRIATYNGTGNLVEYAQDCKALFVQRCKTYGVKA